MSWAKPGVKCICIDTEWFPTGDVVSPPDRFPVFHAIYTIVATTPDGQCLALGELGLSHSWGTDGFRPLVTGNEADDVAAFEAIAFKPKLDIELEQLEAAWRMSEADEMPAYGTVLADDADLRWIEEQARGGGGK